MGKPVTIYQPFESLLAPMPADKTAMGSMPTAGFQYCEALTTATAFGYHVFPPMDATVRAQNNYIEVLEDGEWRQLDSIPMPEDCRAHWEQIAPEGMKERLPSFIQRFFIPDVLQVFTGLFVACDPEWSILIRPIVNVESDTRVMFYEGIVEADLFQPVPLFINVKILQRNVPYQFERFRPLLQIQPIHQNCYNEQNITVAKIHPDETNFPWDGLRRTTRIFHGDNADLALGSYKKEVRKRRRSGKI